MYKMKNSMWCLCAGLVVLLAFSIQAREPNDQTSSVVGPVADHSELVNQMNSDGEDSGTGPLALHGGDFMTWDKRNCVGEEPGKLLTQESVDQHCLEHGIESHKYTDEDGKTWGCVNCHRRGILHRVTDGEPNTGGGLEIEMINPSDITHGHRHDHGHVHGNQATSSTELSQFQISSEKGLFTVFDNIREILSWSSTIPLSASNALLMFNSRSTLSFESMISQSWTLIGPKKFSLDIGNSLQQR